MKYYLVILACVLITSCSDSFTKHELKFEKQGECTTDRGAVNMISNINGERYIFLECLEDGFDGKNYKVERRSDSLIVSFPGASAAKKAMYKLTLDIDAKPLYHHLILGDREVTVVQQN